MNVVENMSVKVEDTHLSVGDDAMNMSNLHSIEAAQVTNGTLSECETSVSNGAHLSGSKEDEQRKIKTDRDVDSAIVPSTVDVPPFTDVPALSNKLLPSDVAQFEGARFLAELVPFTSSDGVAKVSQIISKEEDLCSDEDVFEAVIESLCGISADNQSDFERNGESLQTMTACDEGSGIPPSRLGPQVCSSLSDTNALSANMRCKSKQSSAPLQKPLTYHANVRDVRVVLVDIFPKNSQESSKHIDSKSCVCVFCVGKFRFPEKLENFVKKGISGKSDNVLPGVRCEKLKGGKWFLCDACPARFIFAHNLKRHSVKDHGVHLCLVCHIKFECDSDLRTHSEMHPAKKQYLCVFCQFKSDTEVDLELHLKSHQGKKCFSCAKCKETFETSYSLSSHVSKHMNKTYKDRVPSEIKYERGEYSPNEAEEKTLLCPYCPAKFRLRSRFKYHVMKHTNEGRFACSHCPSRFTTPSQLKFHTVRHSSETPFACKFCPAKFKRGLTLKNHLMIHNNEKPFACKYCEVKFRERAHLRFHTRIHLNEKPYACTQCDRKCRTAYALKDHLKSHSAERPFVCGVCSRRFHKKYCLQSHMESHTNKPKTLACAHCQARFSNKKQLRVHLMTHSGERPFECVHCRGRFKTKGELKKHIVIHLPEKPFVCNECDMAFRHRRQLLAHKLKHSDARPHACDVCPATFKLRSVLNLHRKMSGHYIGVVFSCEHCAVKFETKKEIRLHMLTHAERKWHFCRHCSDAFRFKCRLKEHLKVKHSSRRPFACPYCPSKYKLKTHLNSHLKCHASKREQMKESSITQIKEEIKEEIV